VHAVAETLGPVMIGFLPDSASEMTSSWDQCYHFKKFRRKNGRFYSL
jgi:hypothetical protein